METKLSKKKIALVSVVSLVFIFMVYKTFFKGKSSGGTHPPSVAVVSSPRTPSTVDSQISSKPELNVSMELIGQLEKGPDIEFNPDIRDIFKEPVQRMKKNQAPVNLPVKSKSLTMAEKKTFYNQYRFKGAILMGTRSVAIINDAFYHVGDSIDGYRIVSISEKNIKFDTNRGILKLKIIYDDE